MKCHSKCLSGLSIHFCHEYIFFICHTSQYMHCTLSGIFKILLSKTRNTSLNSYHFIISNVLPAGMVHSGCVEIWELLALPGRVVDLNIGPAYPHSATRLSTTSHHDCVAQVDAACPTEIID